MAGYSVTYTVVDNATKTINDINKKIQQLRAPMEQQAKAMSKFIDVSGLQKVSDGFSAVARTSAEAFSSIARIVPVMGAITGAATLGGLASLIKGFTDLGYQLERNADYLGTSTQTLNQWQNAVKLAGGNVDDLNEGMKELAKTGYDAALGRNTIAQQRFLKAGISTYDLMHKSATDLMPQVLDYINRFTDARDRETVATQLGGKALYELSEDFRLSGKSYVEWMEAAKKYGAVLDPDRLRRYRQAVGELDVAFSGLGTEITEVMATALTPFIKDFATWVHENQPEIIAAVKQIAEVFSDLAAVLKTIMGYASDVATRLSGMPTAEDVLNESPLAANLTKEQKAAILAAHPGAHATENFGQGVRNWFGLESGAQREERIRKQLGVPSGTGPQSSANAPSVASLADSRKRFADELAANPALREKLLNIAATEQSNPTGNQAVIETMMNRAELRGTSLAEQVKRTSEGGYYAGNDNPTALAANRKMIEGNLDKVLAGSNVSNYATDNASGGLAQKDLASGAYKFASTFGGETFFSPGTGVPRDARNYPGWRASRGGDVANANERGGGGLGTPAGPQAPHTPGGGGAGGVVDQMVALAGTRGSAVREFLRDPSGKIARDPDLGLWCAEFTNAALQHMGVQGTKGASRLMASSFAQWGYQVAAKDVTKGDVLLNYNRKHVGLATGRTRIGPGGNLEIEEVSSNSLGPHGELLNLPGTRWRSDVEVRRSAELAAAQAQGPPMSVAGAGKPANGSVDVTVTHKNAPPGTTVSGTAEGAGVNLVGPRIEQQQLSAA